MIRSSESHESMPESLAETLKRISELDQQSPLENAPQCLNELTVVRDYFIDSDLEDPYWNAVSIEHFHCAQSSALNGDLQAAITFTKDALKAAKRINSEFYDNSESDWISYLEATLAYLQGNIEQLIELVDTCTANKEVIVRLLKGLKKRVTPNYAEDY